MPRVSQQYLDARRAHILAAARRCFLRDGFHETSMQDLFAEAGLSSGAFYRYFPSKADVIIAIVEENIQDIVAMVHELAAQAEAGHDRGLGAALADIVELVARKQRDEQVGAIAVLVWSEALRNPEVARRLRATVESMRTDLAAVVRAHQGRGDVLPADVDVDAFAALLLAVLPGTLLQLAVFGPDPASRVPDALRTLWPAAAAS